MKVVYHFVNKDRDTFNYRHPITVDDLHKLSTSEVINIFRIIMTVNNWQSTERIRAIPRFDGYPIIEFWKNAILFIEDEPEEVDYDY